VESDELGALRVASLELVCGAQRHGRLVRERAQRLQPLG
jgi:hypothetical protein